MEVAKNNFNFDHFYSTVKFKGYGMERQDFHLYVVCGVLVFVCLFLFGVLLFLFLFLFVYVF